MIRGYRATKVTDEQRTRSRARESVSGGDGSAPTGALHAAVGNQAIQRATETGATPATTRSADTGARPFEAGDVVRTTDNLNIREGPGTDEPVLETTPVGVSGDVVGGPARASGYTWWEISYHAGYTGWSAAPWLEQAPDRTGAADTTGADAGAAVGGDERAGAAVAEPGGKTTTVEYLPPLHYYDKVVTIDYNYEKFGPGEVTREIDLPPEHEYDGVFIVQAGSTQKKHYW